MNRNLLRFEICANSVESCLEAQKGGADRVELCAGIPEGGTTPSFGEIKMARKLLTSTKLHVIIRPRGGDFLYTPLELERMEEDIRMCRLLGVDGVVFGCLTEEGEVDMEANRRLINAAKGDWVSEDAAKGDISHTLKRNVSENAPECPLFAPGDTLALRPMTCTFHRAFDRTAAPMKAMEDIIALGCDRILTSGQQPKAIEGIQLLAQLEAATHGRIQLLAGSGVNEDNIREIFNATGIHEYHFSARVSVPSRMKHYNQEVYMGAKGADEANSLVTSAERVRKTIEQLTCEGL